MERFIFANKQLLGNAAGAEAARQIREAIATRGTANIILATGASQFETLATLVASPDIDWSKVTAFHLDEYIAMPITHPASFRKYLKERVADKLPPLNAFHYVNGDAPDPQAECARVGALLSAHPIDVALVGIGENGHLAFNDPPADFETDEPYIIVNLDEACRRQQMGEGWFPTLDDVPRQAISMSIRQIMKSRSIIAAIPDTRKAAAVKAALEGEIGNRCPSSILRRHPSCKIYLDRDSGALLAEK